MIQWLEFPPSTKGFKVLFYFFQILFFFNEQNGFRKKPLGKLLDALRKNELLGGDNGSPNHVPPWIK
jgi:hypothetical protein